MKSAAAESSESTGEPRGKRERFPEFTAADRLMVLAPHPDDEVLACGGLLHRAAQAGVPLRVVFFTCGDNNELAFEAYRGLPVFRSTRFRQMGLLRREEAMDAAGALGLKPENLVFLGYPDFRTLRIWEEHWGNAPPCWSMFTSVQKVPYDYARTPGAPHKGEAVLQDIEGEILDFDPTRILVSHPSDFNVDHRALYLFTLVSLWNLGEKTAPPLHSYLVHFPGWPWPPGKFPEAPLDPPAALERESIWTEYRLSKTDLARKEAAIRFHASQFAYSSRFLLSFMRADEPFADVQPRHLVLPEDGTGTGTLVTRTETGFTGVQEHYARRDRERIYAGIGLKVPLGRQFGVSAQFYGWKKDTPFREMPKIKIETGPLRRRVRDQYTAVETGGTVIVKSPRSLEIGVPLRLLGNPERILASVRTTFCGWEQSRSGWRILRLDA
ncbi:MAG TPA: PIG-L family deacetylase [bacterium]|nr:PIG-L family deacetylase [bacterium]